jgi:hypothetical protein
MATSWSRAGVGCVVREAEIIAGVLLGVTKINGKLYGPLRSREYDIAWIDAKAEAAAAIIDAQREEAAPKGSASDA